MILNGWWYENKHCHIFSVMCILKQKESTLDLVKLVRFLFPSAKKVHNLVLYPPIDLGMNIKFEWLNGTRLWFPVYKIQLLGY